MWTSPQPNTKTTPSPAPQTIPSVSTLNRMIRAHLEGTFFDTWVRGEVSGFKKVASGHAYFSLKDAQSQIKVCLFRPNLMKLRFELQEGMEILVHGRVTIYEARGDYQLVADTAEPLGAGALQLAFEQLKKKLQEEGLFDASHKRQLPFLPKRIAIITSPTAAALQDILKIIGRRFPNREILLFPTLVQGEQAPAQIVHALEALEAWQLARPERQADVAIIGRGGGSIEDLWAFNDERVARAIFACSIPIVSAVGHEVDFSIADFVADLRAPTPSAAAEQILPVKDEIERMLLKEEERLFFRIRGTIEQLRLHLMHLARRTVHPKQKIQENRDRIQNLERRLTLASQGMFRLRRSHFHRLTEKLDSLSPLRVLDRGFSITTLSAEPAKVVRSTLDAPRGTRIQTRLASGTLVSEVL